MTGSCPVSARVCQETARERDELRGEVERLRRLAITRARQSLDGPTLQRLKDIADEVGVNPTEGDRDD